MSPPKEGSVILRRSWPGGQASIAFQTLRSPRILILRACAIGDFILNLPALKALSKAAPGARFTLVGYPASLELAQRFIAVEAIHSIEIEPWNRLFWAPAPALDFDAAIVWSREEVLSENL